MQKKTEDETNPASVPSGVGGNSPRSTTRAFVSHAYVDSASIESLRQVAGDRCLTIFPPVQVDEDQFVSESILNAIVGCDELIYITSDKSDNSFWVALEVDFARRNGKRIYAFDPYLLSITEDKETPAHYNVAFHWQREDQAFGSTVVSSLPSERGFTIYNNDPLVRELGLIGFPGMTIAASGASVFIRSGLNFDRASVPEMIEAYEEFRQFRLARYFENTPPILLHILKADDYSKQISLYEMLSPGISPRDLSFVTFQVDPTCEGDPDYRQLDMLCAQLCWRHTRERFGQSDFSSREMCDDLTLSGIDIAATLKSAASSNEVDQVKASTIEYGYCAIKQALATESVEKRLSLLIAAHDILLTNCEHSESAVMDMIKDLLFAHASAELSRLYLIRDKGIEPFNLNFICLHGMLAERYFTIEKNIDLVQVLASRIGLAQQKLAMYALDSGQEINHLRTAIEYYGTCVKDRGQLLSELDISIVVANCVTALARLRQLQSDVDLEDWYERAEAAIQVLDLNGKPEIRDRLLFSLETIKNP
jgi:hypothetical protein